MVGIKKNRTSKKDNKNATSTDTRDSVHLFSDSDASVCFLLFLFFVCSIAVGFAPFFVCFAKKCGKENSGDSVFERVVVSKECAVAIIIIFIGETFHLVPRGENNRTTTAPTSTVLFERVENVV